MSTVEETREGFYLSDDGEWIPDGWKYQLIGDEVSLAQGVAINKKTDFILCDASKGVPLLKINNLLNDSVDHYVDPELVTPKAMLHSNDVVYTRTGQPGWVFRNKTGVLHNNSFKVIPSKNLDRGYLFWYLKQKQIFDYIQKVASGSAQPDLSHDTFKTIPILLPPVNEQKLIAKVLDVIDNKIELLREQNETLEALAQTLFKRWFIDFNFPDENGNPYKDSGGKMIPSELGDIPDGWTVGNLKSFGDVVCGKTPSKTNSAYYGDEIPFIKIPDMHGNTFILKAGEYLSAIGTASQSKKTIPKGSLMVSCIATVGLVAITSSASQTNQQINSIVPKETITKEYLFLMLKTLYDFMQNLGAGGSATLNINTTSFSEIKVICPKHTILNFFHETVSPLFEKIEANSYNIQTLTLLRDTLLPKLMKGEIRIPVSET